jgi:hypothetical protein
VDVLEAFILKKKRRWILKKNKRLLLIRVAKGFQNNTAGINLWSACQINKDFRKVCEFNLITWYSMNGENNYEEPKNSISIVRRGNCSYGRCRTSPGYRPQPL